jgi:hypothetical protein
MYHYLNTLRLLDSGATLAVGPNRRVVFRARIISPSSHRYADMRKDELKRVLSPLRRYWGCDEAGKGLDRERDPDRPLMTFTAFKLAAKRLLADAGMLLDRTAED